MFWKKLAGYNPLTIFSKRDGRNSNGYNNHNVINHNTLKTFLINKKASPDMLDYVDKFIHTHPTIFGGILDLANKTKLISFDYDLTNELVQWSVIRNGPHDSAILEEFYDELHGFRKIAGSGSLQYPHLYDIDRIMMTKVSRALYRYSPAYRFIIEYHLNIFFMQGVQIKFENARDQQKFDLIKSKLRFCFDEYCYTALRHLQIDGELFIPIIPCGTSRYELSNINALTVARVQWDKDNPIIPQEVEYLPLRGDTKHMAELGGSELKSLKVVKHNAKFYDDFVDKCIYVRTSGWFGVRGRVQYESILDWVYKLDRILETRSDFWRWRGGVLFDVTIEGANADALSKRELELRRNPPSSTSILLHNEKEQWNTINESGSGGRAMIIQTDVDAFRSHISQGANIGPKEMSVSNTSDDGTIFANEITHKVNNVFVPVIHWIVDALFAINKYRIPKYEVISSGVSTTIAKSNAITLQQTVMSLEVCRKHGWIEPLHAKELVYKLIQRGVPNDFTESNNKEYIDVGELNSFLNTLSNAVVSGILTVDVAKDTANKLFDQIKSNGMIVGTGVQAIKLKKKDVDDKTQK